MGFRNKGTEAEDTAKGDLQQVFSYVKKSPHNAFYDYLVKKGTTTIRVEVKFVHFEHKQANVVLRWTQFHRLVSSYDFIFYIMSNRGNLFVSPKDFLRVVHIHHNAMNPNYLNAIFNVKNSGNGLKVAEPKQCKLCCGRFEEWLKNQSYSGNIIK